MTFYFYDLETSGFNPRTARIMQFGGQRTDMDLKPIGQPSDILIKLDEDILPDPDAILVTGITPQKTLAKGISEAEFMKIFSSEIATSDTIFVGFNNVRFDDEFMRFLHYRNFYDAYEWQWKDGRGRWDLLDTARMTRALRPEGIKWPVNSEGIQTNNLGDLAILNKLSIATAHDALSDALTTIELARLLKNNQPKLFDYLLKMRKKENIAKLVKSGQPFIYTSGKYPSEFEKTTVVSVIANHPERQGVLVYDLRIDPRQFENMSSQDLVAIWHPAYPAYRSGRRQAGRPIDDEEVVLPIKTLQFNRCPAVAPLGVLDKKSEKRLLLDMKKIEENLSHLKSMKNWPDKILAALDILNKTQQTAFLEKETPIDAKLYDGFFNDHDRRTMNQVVNSKPSELDALAQRLQDERLKELIPFYKARNFFEYLDQKEKTSWLDYCRAQLLDKKATSGFENYFANIKILNIQKGLTKQQQHLLKDLEDYGHGLKAKLS